MAQERPASLHFGLAAATSVLNSTLSTSPCRRGVFVKTLRCSGRRCAHEISLCLLRHRGGLGRLAAARLATRDVRRDRSLLLLAAALALSRIAACSHAEPA